MDTHPELIECARLVARRQHMTRAQDPAGPANDRRLLKAGIASLVMLRRHGNTELLNAVQEVVLREPVLTLELVLKHQGCSESLLFHAPNVQRYSGHVYSKFDQNRPSAKTGVWVSDASCTYNPQHQGFDGAAGGRIVRRCLYTHKPHPIEAAATGAMALLRALAEDGAPAADGLVRPLPPSLAEIERRLGRAACYERGNFLREARIIMDALKLQEVTQDHPLARKADGPPEWLMSSEAAALRAYAEQARQAKQRRRLAIGLDLGSNPAPASPVDEPASPAPLPVLRDAWELVAVQSTLSRPAVAVSPISPQLTSHACTLSPSALPHSSIEGKTANSQVSSPARGRLEALYGALGGRRAHRHAPRAEERMHMHMAHAPRAEERREVCATKAGAADRKDLTRIVGGPAKQESTQRARYVRPKFRWRELEIGKDTEWVFALPPHFASVRALQPSVRQAQAEVERRRVELAVRV